MNRFISAVNNMIMFLLEVCIFSYHVIHHHGDINKSDFILNKTYLTINSSVASVYIIVS